jgi:hypothetical protein
LRTTLHSHATHRWRGFFPNHKCGIPLANGAAQNGRAGNSLHGDLFDEAKQRLAALRPSVASPLVVGEQHRVAQGFQFGVADAVELHPQIKDGHRYQLGGIGLAGLPERGPALLEGCENGKQFFV